MTKMPKDGPRALDRAAHENVVRLDRGDLPNAIQPNGTPSEETEPELTIDEVARTIENRDRTRRSTRRRYRFRLSRNVKWALGLIGLTIAATKWKEIAATVSAIGKSLGYE